MDSEAVKEVFTKADTVGKGTFGYAVVEAVLMRIDPELEGSEIRSLLLASGSLRGSQGEFVDYCALIDFFASPPASSWYQPGSKQASEQKALVIGKAEAGKCVPQSLADASATDVAHNLYKRGFSVRQLMDFVKKYHTHSRIRISDRTTADVVRDIIIPETRQKRCAMAELFEGGLKEPVCLVSHCWGQNFMLLVEAIMAHASGQVLANAEMCTEDDLEKTYWLCIFGVNQHVSICGTESYPCDCRAEKWLNDHPLCEMNKFGLMMKHISEHVLVMDNNLVSLSRIWVLKELHTALSLGISTELCGDVPGDMSVIHMPSVRDALATREEDKRFILADVEYSPGVEAFDAMVSNRVWAEHKKFDLIDAVAKRDTKRAKPLLAADPTLCNVQLR